MKDPGPPSAPRGHCPQRLSQMGRSIPGLELARRGSWGRSCLSLGVTTECLWMEGPQSRQSPSFKEQWERLPNWLSGQESACQCRRHKRHGFDLWVRKILCRRKWHPTPVPLPGNSMSRVAWQATVHGLSKNQTRVCTSLSTPPPWFSPWSKPPHLTPPSETSALAS